LDVVATSMIEQMMVDVKPEPFGLDTAADLLGFQGLHHLDIGAFDDDDDPGNLPVKIQVSKIFVGFSKVRLTYNFA
jgi:hypothetical protein